MAEVFEGHDRLKIFVDASRPVRAVDIAQIIKALDRSFSKFCREEYGLQNVRLHISESASGSWWAILIAMREFVDISREYPEIIPIFANNIHSTYQALVNNGPAETKQYATYLLKELANAGRKTQADAIDLITVVRVSIRAEHYGILESSEEIVPRAREFASKGEIPMELDRPSLERADHMLEQGTLVAAVFQVDGTWYARPTGFEGVLLPLRINDDRVDLKDGQIYAISGRITYSPNHFPNGIQVFGMQNIGNR